MCKTQFFIVQVFVACAIAEPLGKIDKITMYGEGNTARLTEDVTKSFKQTIDGLSDSIGMDLNSLVTTFFAPKGEDMAGVAEGGSGSDSDASASDSSDTIETDFREA